MNTTVEIQKIDGAVKIGNGAKLHKAFKDENNKIWICCKCPGTQQGGAYHYLKFFADVQATCKN